MLVVRMLFVRTLMYVGVFVAAFALLGGEAHAKKVSFAPITIEGKVLRQRPKGKVCKIEIDVTQASIRSKDARPVRARLVMLQPCVEGLKVGSKATGIFNCSRLRANTRTTKDGTAILEFSARVHGRLVSEEESSTTGNFVADTSATSGRLIGDADPSPSQ